jgi:Tol biopolymer transport system component
VNADGPGLTNLFPRTRRTLELDPAWSPDGSKIVFSRYEKRYQLYLVSPDGSGLAQLTHGPSDTEPDWQPIS